MLTHRNRVLVSLYNSLVLAIIGRYATYASTQKLYCKLVLNFDRCVYFPYKLLHTNMTFRSSFKIMISSRDILRSICILNYKIRFSCNLKERKITRGQGVTASIQTDLLIHQSNLNDQIRSTF